jgi:hypothetical protein
LATNGFATRLRKPAERLPKPPTGMENRLAALEATTAELRSTLSALRGQVATMHDRLAALTTQAEDAERLSNEDGKALEFVLMEVNEIRRDLDAVIERERP